MLPSFNNQNIEFYRQATLDVVTRPQAALALYPKNSDGTSLSVNVSSSSISIRYISSGTETYTIQYIGKTAEELALAINELAIPIKAVPTLRNTILKSGDIFLYDSTSYFKIPNGFNITDRLIDSGVLVRSKKVTVKHNNLINFKLLPPYGKNLFEPWYPVISNGEFSYKENSRTYRFSIPEFNNQVWSIKYGKPFKDVIDGSLTYVRQNTFRVQRTPIHWTSGSIKLYNNDVFIPESIIEDIDTENGLIYFKPNNVISDRTKIDYSYLEKNFEYTGIDLNCHITHSPDLLDKFVILYAKPSEGNSYSSSKKTIYHIVADSPEEAINSIESLENNVPIVIIGGYNVQQVYTSDRISILDTRSLGGGLRSTLGPKSPVHKQDSLISDLSNLPKIEDSLTEKQSFWDIGNFDGSSYPGAGSVVIELPLEIKNKLPESDIRQRATKFLGAGIYPIISYYDQDLPAISGASTQISLFLNGGMIESLYGVTGNCWSRSPINLPGHGATGTWNIDSDNLSPPIIKVDNTGVIATTPAYGTYQSYLKSSPIAGIEYYKRTLSLANSALGDEKIYTPWERIRVLDDRVVPTGQLIKGYVSFESSLNTTEIRSIKVNSPYRLDNLSGFKNDIAEELATISDSYRSRSTDLQVTSPYYGNITISPVVSKIDDLSIGSTTRYTDYIGISPAREYLHDVMQGDLSGYYTGDYFSLANEIVEATKQVSNRLKFFSTEYLSYQDYTTETENLDASRAISNAAIIAGWRKIHKGSTDPIYTGISGKIPEMLSYHTILDNKYLPARYKYTITDVGDVSPVVQYLHKIPEISGYQYSEVLESNNTDFEYLYSSPNLMSAVRLIDNFTGGYSSAIRPYIQTIWSGVDAAVGRSNSAIAGTRTINGFASIQHWYVPYNRYGKYAGSLSNQLIDCYEHLYSAQSYTISGLSWSGTPGLDVNTLNDSYKDIENVLSYAYSGFSETIIRGGILDEYTSDLLYSYGWYVQNSQKHISHVTGYSPSASINSGLIPLFSGLFLTGINTLIKGMVTPNGDMFETVIINGDQGPFAINTPSKIIDTLAIACKLDMSFKPLAQAVFNTIKNNYGVNGSYYIDPLKADKSAGHEDLIAGPLARLYNSL